MTPKATEVRLLPEDRAELEARLRKPTHHSIVIPGARPMFSRRCGAPYRMKMLMVLAATLLCFGCSLGRDRTALIGTVAVKEKDAGKCFQAQNQRAADLISLYC